MLISFNNPLKYCQPVCKIVEWAGKCGGLRYPRSKSSFAVSSLAIVTFLSIIAFFISRRKPGSNFGGKPLSPLNKWSANGAAGKPPTSAGNASQFVPVQNPNLPPKSTRKDFANLNNVFQSNQGPVQTLQKKAGRNGQAVIPHGNGVSRVQHRPAPAVQLSRYSLEAVWGRFWRNHGGTLNEAGQQAVHDQAIGLVKYVLSKEESLPFLIALGLELNKKGEQAGDSTSLRGKLYALSLKIAVCAFKPEMRSGQALGPVKSKRTGQPKKSPVERLTGSFATMYRSSNNTRHVLLVLKVLGSGHYNRASLVYHMGFKKEYVIRALTPESLQNPQTLAEWDQEVRVQKMLSDNKVPGIVEIADTYTSNGKNGQAPYRVILLEKCSGTLEEFCKPEVLPPKSRLDIMRQTLHSLCEMKTRGYAHFDLKPDNILYQQDAQGRIIPKLADFGKAQRAERKEGTPGLLLFTPLDGFLKGRLGEQYAFAVDAWALGLTFYELRFGKFTGHHQLMNRVINFFRNFSSHQPFLTYYSKQDSLDSRHTFISEAERFYNLRNVSLAALNNPERDLFVNDVYNHILWLLFKNQFDALFHNICANLMRLGGTEAHIIAGLLSPEEGIRLKVEDAYDMANKS